MKPLTDEEIEIARNAVKMTDALLGPMPDGPNDPLDHGRWLATVDDLRAKLANADVDRIEYQVRARRLAVAVKWFDEHMGGDMRPPFVRLPDTYDDDWANREADDLLREVQATAWSKGHAANIRTANPYRDDDEDRE